MKKEISQAEQEAISIVLQERNNWEDATAFVTEKVAFKMRDLIRTCRKNYWGIFDSPYDPITGREKIWIPLSEVMTEASIKSYDLDTKDVNFRAKNPNGYAVAEIVRPLVREYLDKTYFGMDLDELERDIGIDGTAVWKTWERDDKPCRVKVPLLNVYIDPTAESIQKAFRFTERSLTTSDALAGMTGWSNTKGIQGKEGLAKEDSKYNSNSSEGKGNKYIDVWEMWGKIPKWMITSKSRPTDDNGELIDGHVVVSGLDGNNPICHLIEENKKKDADSNVIKPYEEAWAKKVSGRWYGKGICEQLLMIQLWINTIVNIRINRAQVSQLGIFKIRKGAGITPQAVSRIGSNGAIVVENMDDIDQFVMQEAGQSSYTDEDVANSWAQRLTNAFEVVTGETLPGSTPATNAVLQDRNAKSSFTMVKEGLGFFIQRWVDRHLLPILAKSTKVSDIVRVAGDDEKIKKYVERAIAFRADQILEETYQKGLVPSEEEMNQAFALAEQELGSRGDLFVEVMEEIIANNVDCKVFVTNEEIDVAVTVDKLMAMLPQLPEYRIALAKEAFNLMGLEFPRQDEMPQQAPQGGMEAPTQSLQGLVTGANV